MPIFPGGLVANVYQSLDAYLRTAIITGMGLALQLPGSRRFVPPPEEPWVTADYSLLTMERSFKRHIGGSRLGTEVSGLLSLAIYQQARIFATDYLRGLAALRDTLLGYFPESGMLPIYDFLQVSGTPPSDPPQVAALYIEMVNDQVLDQGETSGVVCWQIQPTLRYLEEFTR